MNEQSANGASVPAVQKTMPYYGRARNDGSLKNYVYRQVIEKICEGTLAPDTIFTERQMLEEFGVSKAPVREALIQLCNEDVLRSIPRCGYQVIQISSRNIRELTKLRLILELSSLPEVHKNLTEEKIREFKSMNAARLGRADNKDIWTAWNNNIRYHILLNECAENHQVTAALERALAACTRAYAQAYKEDRNGIAPSQESFHDKIIEALEKGELYTAQNCLRQDILMMEKQLLTNSYQPGI